MKDRLEAAAAMEEAYPYSYRAPYEGVPRDVIANFVWVPIKEEGVALFMFQREADRDAFAERFEVVPAELPRKRRTGKAA